LGKKHTETISSLLSSLPTSSLRVGRFFPEGGKTVFPWKKEPGLAKTVFAGKSRFLPDYIFITIKYCYTVTITMTETLTVL